MGTKGRREKKKPKQPKLGKHWKGKKFPVAQVGAEV